MTDLEIIEHIIADEGGEKFTCNPADPGGATKWGITARGIRDYWNHEATPEQIQTLTHDDAVTFYKWLLVVSKIGSITNADVKFFVFDAAVHMGTTQATKLLQRALGVLDDGIIGSATLAAVPYLDGTKLCRLFAIEQMLFYGRLAAKNLTDADKDGVPDQLEFLPGYLNRLARKMRTVV